MTFQLENKECFKLFRPFLCLNRSKIPAETNIDREEFVASTAQMPIYCFRLSTLCASYPLHCSIDMYLQKKEDFKCPSIDFDYSHSMRICPLPTALFNWCVSSKKPIQFFSRTPWISPLSKNEQSRVLINGILMLSFGHCVRTYILYNSYKTKTLLEYMIAPSL